MNMSLGLPSVDTLTRTTTHCQNVERVCEAAWLYFFHGSVGWYSCTHIPRFYGTHFKHLHLRIYATDFVAFCSNYVDQIEVTAVKVAFKHKKSCSNKKDLKFGVTSIGTQCKMLKDAFCFSLCHFAFYCDVLC